MLLLGVAVTKGRRMEESKHVALGSGTETSMMGGLKFLTDEQSGRRFGANLQLQFMFNESNCMMGNIGSRVSLTQ